MMTADELAKTIVDYFDEFLSDKDIKVVCADKTEEDERNADHKNYAALYGTEYWNLVDWVGGLLERCCNFDEDEN